MVNRRRAGQAHPQPFPRAGGELAEVVRRLAAVSDTPRLDAELLLAQALGITREALLLNPPPASPDDFETLIQRRLAHEPIAYILGTRDFWSVSLAVRPGVLIPRPDSETLIEAAVAHFRGTSGPRSVLDLGTGSGALLVAALVEWPEAVGIGVDRSPEAITVARENLTRLGLEARGRIVPGDWTGAGGPHELILCNPPYIATAEVLPHDVAHYEPAEALFAGADGLDDYRAIAPVLARQLAAGGIACIEIGSSHAEAAGALFGAQGLAVDVRRDLGGRDRCLVLTRP